MSEVEIRRFSPEDRDWVVAAHGDHYAREEGFDASFGVLVGEIVDGFVTDHDPSAEAGWIVWRGVERLGGIFCVRLNKHAAKLRLFWLTDGARGQGLGKRLLATCMEFAKDRGFSAIQLWTHEEHAAAGALYAKTGWTLMRSEPAVSFGQRLVEQHWRITL